MANEKRLIDNVTNADCCGEKQKIKTHFAKIIVGGTVEKPCYNILYFDPTDKEYHIGFGSFYLEYVFKWLSEEFEIMNAPITNVVEVVHGRWVDKEDYYIETGMTCSVCGERYWLETSLTDFKPYNYCPNCGVKMDLKGE